MRRAVGVALIGALIGGPVVLAGTAPAAARGLVVAELFTSEGCSSCPPADALLTEIARDRPDVLPLAFHVTYWNSLGWRDPFSLDAATARQRAYQQALGLDAIYTPQLVVGGTIDVVGSDRDGVLAALDRGAAPGPALAATVEDGAVRIALGAGAGQGSVLLVGFDARHTTPVGRGENAGRTLVETNVVRGLRPAGTWTGAAAVLHAAPPPGERVAVLLQAPDGRILAAALVRPAGA